MKVTTLNVNGLRSAERRGFRDWLARTQPDVLCLQEIRADESAVAPDLWNPPGYRAAWHPARKKGYAGTAVWARSEGARFTTGCGHARGQEEGRLVGAHLDGLDVWSLYMPSGSSSPEAQAWKDQYMEHMLPWFRRVVQSGRPALVCGDINIAHTPMDIRNAKENAKKSGFMAHERAWLDALVEMGWRDLFREANPTSQAYSWWSQRGGSFERDVGWRIDHIWATPGVAVERVDIERDASLSDHAPVTARIRE
jgi:exodeoxyribonuclease III